jgi:hypothetical protein
MTSLHRATSPYVRAIHAMPPGAALRDCTTSLALFVIIVRFTSAAFAAGDPAAKLPPFARRICSLLNGRFRQPSVPNLPIPCRLALPRPFRRNFHLDLLKPKPHRKPHRSTNAAFSATKSSGKGLSKLMRSLLAGWVKARVWAWRAWRKRRVSSGKAVLSARAALVSP